MAPKTDTDVCCSDDTFTVTVEEFAKNLPKSRFVPYKRFINPPKYADHVFEFDKKVCLLDKKVFNFIVCLTA